MSIECLPRIMSVRGREARRRAAQKAPFLLKDAKVMDCDICVLKRSQKGRDHKEEKWWNWVSERECSHCSLCQRCVRELLNVQVSEGPLAIL